MDTSLDFPLLVCFGDSLTAGYQISPESGHPLPDAPYGGFVQQWLGARGQVVISGICGELTSEMVKRFHRDVIAQQPSMTVILGGTNDLGWGAQPSQIYENLRKLYHMALDVGIQPIGVTVPSLRTDGIESSFAQSSSQEQVPPLPSWLQFHITQRFVLNRMILETCRDLDIPSVDLFQETAEGSHHLLAARFSSDGLHLNTQGYEQFAKLVWQTVFSHQFGEPT